MTQRTNAEDTEMNREDAERMGSTSLFVSAFSPFSSATSALKGNCYA
jgi:hypothetical protein